jgi:hypothetical protein
LCWTCIPTVTCKSHMAPVVQPLHMHTFYCGTTPGARSTQSVLTVPCSSGYCNTQPAATLAASSTKRLHSPYPSATVSEIFAAALCSLLGSGVLLLCSSSSSTAEVRATAVAARRVQCGLTARRTSKDE